MDATLDKYQSTVNAAPVKSFFVSMLTRDIRLEEAILDLLDNCVDGILRTKELEGDKPYEGSWAEIKFDRDSFSIEDNCGGIPWSLSEYAFRMGRDPKRKPDAGGLVGVYGIGMKRAIFKMGKSCSINTRSGDDRYEVEFTPEWMDDETDWEVPVTRSEIVMSEDGTKIVVRDLLEGVVSQFSTLKSFQAELIKLISTHYALIIDKGFHVTVNGREVKPRLKGLVFAEEQIGPNEYIRPFIYKATTETNVEVFLAVGLTEDIPSENVVFDEQEERQRSSEDAGWTIVCNDRVVLFCDRSELTGWGEAGVPRYHTQFISISGIVEFKCDDPAELPMTTTKRGVDASSHLYLQVKNKMREGMKMFTDYTNRWKGRKEESDAHIESGKPLTIPELKDRSETIQFRSVRQGVLRDARQSRPNLPKPNTTSGVRRIAFTKEKSKVDMVAEHLGTPKSSPSEIGEKCFDRIFEEALS